MLAFAVQGEVQCVGCAWSALGGANHAAGLTAAKYACLLACCLPGSAEVAVGYDNCQIAGAIDMSQSIQENRVIADMVVAMARAARRRRGLQTQHFKSHTGHPWNELADSLAGQKHKDELPNCQYSQSFDAERPRTIADSQYRSVLDGQTDGAMPRVQGHTCLVCPTNPPMCSSKPWRGHQGGRGCVTRPRRQRPREVHGYRAP